jgi:twitching motility protein PilT
MEIKQLLQTVVDAKASDLHLIAGSPAMLRVDGKLLPVSTLGILTPDTISEILKQVLTSEQIERLTVNKELDFSLAFSDKGRFRVNAYTQKNSLAAAFRLIPLTIPAIEAFLLFSIHLPTCVRVLFL